MLEDDDMNFCHEFLACENTVNEFCRFLRLISVIVTLALKRQFFYINHFSSNATYWLPYIPELRELF